MLNKTVKKGLMALLMAGAGLLGMAGQSQAAVFVGSFDPPYGGTYGNLGFRGVATIVVPDACLAFNGFVSNGAACSLGGMFVQSATVELYDVTNPLVTLDSDNFAPPSQSLLDVLLSGGELLGANSVYFGGVQMNTGGESPLFQGTLWMRFFEPDEFSVDPVFLCDQDPGPNSTSCPGQLSNGAPILRFDRVPEPASISLLVAALGAGFASRRCRRRLTD